MAHPAIATRLARRRIEKLADALQIDSSQITSPFPGLATVEADSRTEANQIALALAELGWTGSAETTKNGALVRARR